MHFQVSQLCFCLQVEALTNKLMIFERKVMRKIFDPTRTDDGYW